MEIKIICDNILWMWYGLGRAELYALIDYLTHKEIVDIHRISKDTNIPEGTVLVCVNRLYSKQLLAFVTPAMVHTDAYNRVYIIFMLVVVVAGYTVLLVVANAKPDARRWMPIFFFILLSSTALDSFISTNDRVTVPANNRIIEWEKGDLNASTAEALDYLQEIDSTFYRVEKDYAIWQRWSDSYFFRYSSTEWYNSVANKNLIEFYNNLYPSAGNPFLKVFILESNQDQMANNIIDSRYLLSKFGVQNDSWELINVIEDILIYKNKETNSVAKWYTNTVTRDTFGSLTEKQKIETLANSVILIDGEYSYEEATAQIGDFYLENPAKLVGKVKCNGEGILMLAIPDQKGWCVEVDGEESSIINCYYGFIGVQLEQGEHTVTASYHVPLMYESAWVSVIGVIVLVLIVSIELMSKHRNCRI